MESGGIESGGMESGGDESGGDESAGGEMRGVSRSWEQRTRSWRREKDRGKEELS